MLEENRLPDEDVLEPEADEVDWVLATLRGLLEHVASPIVRICLEETCDDIAHLVGRDVEPMDSANEEEVA